MSKMIEVKTADLIGYPLEWAVAKTEGIDCLWEIRDLCDHGTAVPTLLFLNPIDCILNVAGRFSTDWGQGGPLIDQHTAMIRNYPNSEVGDKAAARVVHDGTAFWQGGPTPLIALCRAIVAAKLGDVVRVPAELIPTN